MGGIDYQEVKPIYASVCVKTELQIVGYETHEYEGLTGAASPDVEPLSFSNFNRDDYLPPEGWVPPDYSNLAYPPTPDIPSTEVPLSPGWIFMILGLTCFISYMKSLRKGA